MRKWIADFIDAWRGVSQPSPALVFAFTSLCLVVGTGIRWGIALIRPETPFSPYFPAILFAAAFGGTRAGLAATIGGGLLGFLLNFSRSPQGAALTTLFVAYVVVSALIIWGTAHYRSVVAHHRDISTRLIKEEEYRKLIVDELQHRLKNKLATIHAVVRQVLHRHPEIWSQVDGRIRALSTTDELIARTDERGCDLKDLLQSELGPYGSVRLTLIGDAVFLPPKLAVSLALVFHELATNASKYGAFSSPTGLLNVSWTRDGDRLNIIWDEMESPPTGTIGAPGFGTRLLGSALRAFDGSTDIKILPNGLHCMMQCRIPADDTTGTHFGRKPA